MINSSARPGLKITDLIGDASVVDRPVMSLSNMLNSDNETVPHGTVEGAIRPTSDLKETMKDGIQIKNNHCQASNQGMKVNIPLKEVLTEEGDLQEPRKKLLHLIDDIEKAEDETSSKKPKIRKGKIRKDINQMLAQQVEFQSHKLSIVSKRRHEKFLTYRQNTDLTTPVEELVKSQFDILKDTVERNKNLKIGSLHPSMKSLEFDFFFELSVLRDTLFLVGNSAISHLKKHGGSTKETRWYECLHCTKTLFVLREDSKIQQTLIQHMSDDIFEHKCTYKSSLLKVWSKFKRTPKVSKTEKAENDIKIEVLENCIAETLSEVDRTIFRSNIEDFRNDPGLLSVFLLVTGYQTLRKSHQIQNLCPLILQKKTEYFGDLHESKLEFKIRFIDTLLLMILYKNKVLNQNYINRINKMINSLNSFYTIDKKYKISSKFPPMKDEEGKLAIYLPNKYKRQVESETRKLQLFKKKEDEKNNGRDEIMNIELKYN